MDSRYSSQNRNVDPDPEEWSNSSMDLDAGSDNDHLWTSSSEVDLEDSSLSSIDFDFLESDLSFIESVGDPNLSGASSIDLCNTSIQSCWSDYSGLDLSFISNTSSEIRRHRTMRKWDRKASSSGSSGSRSRESSPVMKVPVDLDLHVSKARKVSGSKTTIHEIDKQCSDISTSLDSSYSSVCSKTSSPIIKLSKIRKVESSGIDRNWSDPLVHVHSADSSVCSKANSPIIKSSKARTVKSSEIDSFWSDFFASPVTTDSSVCSKASSPVIKLSKTRKVKSMVKSSEIVSNWIDMLPSHMLQVGFRLYTCTCRSTCTIHRVHLDL